jgi:Leucine-rich repeat (LRR) protein
MILYFLLAFLCTLSVWSCGKKPKDSEKAEQYNFASRTFNSKVYFDVSVKETPLSEPNLIGRTPSNTPLEIPACWVWFVKPGIEEPDGVLLSDSYWESLTKEINQNRIPGLDLIKNLTDSDLKRLKSLTRLQWLSLLSTDITDAGIDYLKGLNELRWLYLYTPRITDAGLEHLAGLNKLQILHLGGSWSLEDGSERWRFYRGTGEISIKPRVKEFQKAVLDRTNITDEGLEHLEGLTGLQQLFLSNTKITDDGLKYLKRLTRLQQLYLDGTDITGMGLKHLKDLTDLQVLDLSSAPHITDAGLEYLTALTTLQELCLGDTWITDTGLEHLKNLNKLRFLDLSGTQNITDAGIAHLKSLNGLQRLMLNRTNITDAGMVHIVNLTGLQELDLSGTKVTDVGIKQLRQRLPSLRIIE